MKELRHLTLAFGFLLSPVFCLLSSPAAFAADPPAKRTELDDSIDRALVFLQRMQEADGSWKASRAGKNPAITALAVMAFLSAGHVPGEGRYGDTVEKGIEWVLHQQHANGLIAPDAGYEMYSHGICTLMLAEVAGMTDGKLADEVRKRLEKAVAIVLKAQRKGTHANDPHRGGWRYQVNSNDSDISVTGWQIMALRAAKNVGCDVPSDSIEQAVAYIKRCRDPGTGGFRYQSFGAVTVPCTGTSILALELCGKEQHGSEEILKAASYLLKSPPRWGQYHFFYSIYYCSQATFQVGGSYWDHYREKLHEVLGRNQNENGCWYGSDAEGAAHGASYCTAMCVLALTVEYRYLPIYQRGEEPQKGK